MWSDAMGSNDGTYIAVHADESRFMRYPSVQYLEDEWRRSEENVAELRDSRVQASPEEIAKSLEGNRRPELLFLL
jgi:hypothetical protein